MYFFFFKLYAFILLISTFVPGLFFPLKVRITPKMTYVIPDNKVCHAMVIRGMKMKGKKQSNIQAYIHM